MSNIDYRQHFLHAVNGLRTQGLSTAEIIALVIGEAVKKNTSPAASVEPVRMVSIELANGMTKNVPWTPDMDIKPAIKAAPAKPVVVPKQEIVFAKSRNTSYDLQTERYKEDWVPPANWEQPTAAEQAEVAEITADAEQEIAEMEATLAARRAEYAQFKTSMAASDATK